MSFSTLTRALLISTTSGRWQEGSCPANSAITLQSSFDKSRFFGKWFEAARDYWTLYEIGGECNTATYTERSDSSTLFGVTNAMVYWFMPLIPIAVSATASIDPDTSGQLYISFSDYPGSREGADFKVLDTDYDNYAIIYSCQNKNNWWGTAGREDVAYLLTRAAEPDPTWVDQKLATVSTLTANHYDASTGMSKPT